MNSRTPRTCFLEIRSSDGRLIQRFGQCNHDDYAISLTTERQKDDVKDDAEKRRKHWQGQIDEHGPLLMYVEARDSAANVVEQIAHQEDERKEL